MSGRERAPGAAVIIGFATIGWAYCGALIGVGRLFLPMHTTLIVHALGAPVGFAALSTTSWSAC